MSSLVVVLCTLLAAASVVLTRLRLRRGQVAGRGRSVLTVHTVAGLTALVLWLALLVLGTTWLDAVPDDAASLLGIVALAAWWVTAGAGLMILARWLPARGKRAAATATDGWSAGPGLSLLAHLGTLVCVGVLTWAYADGRV
ncbi:hypothetical protein [Nocardioides sp. AX2bis]|uniref:hypothetical protein n=1 Tax=Nocardioides sp. AX2bis TaxID=2653157 RepID=UPI0012F24CAA|nr:hypothetical protein [Nocardioides sp. AX2bis]VXB99414.1 conserved membrane hypothetical protein [Nocardioides sp. AX2bis]